ncbi:MAG: PQQ-like beta-propeller repeat protein [Verrucomicrobiae bacterium]|nr:PQQ-like beta-propeller repeat protein [Verrucomicrobiae bacterium]
MKSLAPLASRTPSLLALLALLPATVAANDWPHWRGPERTGISLESDWNPLFPPDGPPVLWRAQVGIGFAAVSVADGRAFTTGNREDHDTLHAFDAATGQVLWQHRYQQPLDPKYYEGGTSASPTVDGHRVYLLSRRGDLFALDAATGAVAWQKDIAREVGARIPTWGFAGSVLIDGDRAVLNVGAHGAAVDKHSGRLLWKSGTAESGYATPVPFQHAGQSLYLLFGARELAAVRADNGRKVWSHAWRTSHDVNAADPIVAGPNRVFLASGYNRGAALLEIRGSRPAVVWENKNIRSQMNAPVLLDGHLYAIDGDHGKARLRCVELDSGQVKWTFDDPNHGALSIANGYLIVIGERGELLIGPASPEGFQPVSRAQIGGGRFWTTPVLSHGRLYLRNAAGSLWCLDLGARQP